VKLDKRDKVKWESVKRIREKSLECVYCISQKESVERGVLIYSYGRVFGIVVQFFLPGLVHNNLVQTEFSTRWPMTHYKPPKSLYFLRIFLCLKLIMIFFLGRRTSFDFLSSTRENMSPMRRLPSFFLLDSATNIKCCLQP
jgi:hypothetical protein